MVKAAPRSKVLGFFQNLGTGGGARFSRFIARGGVRGGGVPMNVQEI